MGTASSCAPSEDRNGDALRWQRPAHRLGARDDELPACRPALAATVGTILLPIVLMLLRATVELTVDDKTNGLQKVTDTLGNPPVALLIGLIVAMFNLGTAVGFGRRRISDTVGATLPAIAGIMLIVAAGGGFKQLLVDSGMSELIDTWAKGASFSPLLLGWLVAVGIRLATGLDRPTVALLALAVGAGTLFFSHVNDAGSGWYRSTSG